MPGWPFDNGYFPVYDNFIMIDNYRSDPALRDQIDPAKEDGVPVLIWKELNPYMGPFDAHFVLGRWNEDEESFNVQMIADDLPYGVGEPDIIGVSGCAADAANNYHLLYGYMTMMDEGPMGVKYIRGTFDYDTNELIFSDEVNAFPETTAYGWPSVSAAPGQMGRVVVMWSSGDWGDQMLYSRTGDLIRPE
jgi:hypothetical protein